MEIKETKKLVLNRQPPGDRWSPLDNNIIFDSLTEGLEYVFQSTQCTEFHLSSFDGKIYTVSSEEVEPPPPPEPTKFSLYGEY